MWMSLSAEQKAPFFAVNKSFTRATSAIASRYVAFSVMLLVVHRVLSRFERSWDTAFANVHQQRAPTSAIITMHRELGETRRLSLQSRLA